MAMSKKDYEAIAQAINEFTTTRNAEDMQCLSIKLAEYMAEGNPLFSRSRFLAACLP